MFAELLHEVIDLILQRDFAENTDRLGGLELLLQRDQVERNGRVGRRGGLRRF